MARSAAPCNTPHLRCFPADFARANALLVASADVEKNGRFCYSSSSISLRKTMPVQLVNQLQN
jgi:hypothetical protein